MTESIFARIAQLNSESYVAFSRHLDIKKSFSSLDVIDASVALSCWQTFLAYLASARGPASEKRTD